MIIEREVVKWLTEQATGAEWESAGLEEYLDPNNWEVSAYEEGDFVDSGGKTLEDVNMRLYRRKNTYTPGVLRVISNNEDSEILDISVEVEDQNMEVRGLRGERLAKFMTLTGFVFSAPKYEDYGSW